MPSVGRACGLEGRRPRRLAATLDINHIETFVPAAGEAAGPPIATGVFMRFVPTRDIFYLEGRRPRRLVTTLNIRHNQTFVSAAGGAAGPPIATGIAMRFVPTRDIFTCRKPSNRF